MDERPSRIRQFFADTVRWSVALVVVLLSAAAASVLIGAMIGVVFAAIFATVTVVLATFVWIALSRWRMRR